ncbi:MAG: S1-like domain-containing RNA-binding protein [Bacilli bacterium]|nr:S1-like domain-containing RNA-binding protein [Bacilli bacterium]
MNLKIGEINTLVVEKRTDLGYMLINKSEDEVLLHFSQASREFEIGETIDVFILLDSKKRVTATCEMPFIKVGFPGFVKVTNIVKGLGIFINNNVLKDPLISYDDLPFDNNLWPIVGDTVLCKLKATPTQLIAKLISPEEAKSLFNPIKVLEKFQKVNAIVLKNGVEGVNLITLDGHNIFVYYKHKRRDYRIGEQVLVTINNVGENGNYNGTLLKSKVPLMKEDADIILEYLKENNGVMNITSTTDVQTIDETFNMSKAAFKRALGNLYKKRKIEFKDGKTYLVK